MGPKYDNSAWRDRGRQADREWVGSPEGRQGEQRSKGLHEKKERRKGKEGGGERGMGGGRKREREKEGEKDRGRRR